MAYVPPAHVPKGGEAAVLSVVRVADDVHVGLVGGRLRDEADAGDGVRDHVHALFVRHGRVDTKIMLYRYCSTRFASPTSVARCAILCTTLRSCFEICGQQHFFAKKNALTAHFFHKLLFGAIYEHGLISCWAISRLGVVGLPELSMYDLPIPSTCAMLSLWSPSKVLLIW